LVGLPLAIGLLQKKKYVLSLVYLMFALALLQVAIQLPIAMIHFADQSDKGSAFFEAWMLLLWLLSMVYYRKRREWLT
jgi:heme/copper-type cytochrome/quinol oxidase subunit 4